LGLFIVRFEFVVADGPVFKRAAGHLAVGGPHAEVLFKEAPRHGSVTEGAAADACSVVGVARIAGVEYVLASLIYQYPRVALLCRTETVAQHGRALIVQVVFAAVGCGIPFAALE